MTVLAPLFLIALIALPLLLLLGMLRRRPRRVLVPSTDIWAQVARQVEAQSVKPRPMLDRRLALLMVTALLLALAAANVAWLDRAREPRHVRIWIDRSAAMQMPTGNPQRPTAFEDATEFAAAVADELGADDTMTVTFAPPWPGEGFTSARPADVAAKLRSGNVVASDGTATAPDTGSKVRLSSRVVPGVIAIPTMPALQLVRLGIDGDEALLELALPVDAPAAISPTVRLTRGTSTSGEGIRAGEPIDRALPAIAPGAVQRVVVPVARDADAWMIEVPGAVPPVRAVGRWRFRIAVLPLGTVDAAPWQAMLSAWFPLAEILTVTEGTKPDDVGPLDALVVLTASPEATASLPPAWQARLPMLLVGPIANGVTPFGGLAADAVSRPADVQRLVLRPDHPVLRGVDVSLLPLDGDWWPFVPDPSTAATPLVQVGEGASAIIAITRGRQRAVAIPGGAPLESWPRDDGIGPAVWVGNSLAWLLESDRILADGRSDGWIAGVAGADPMLPPRARRALAAGAAITFTPFGAVEPLARPADEPPFERAGWWTVGGVTIPVNAATGNALQVGNRTSEGSLPSAADWVRDHLPAATRETPIGGQHLLLLAALLAVVALIGTAVWRPDR